MIKKILIALFTITAITACESEASYDVTDPFPTDECTSFVIYATKSIDADPDNTFPSLIHHEYDGSNSGIIADVAPYLTALDAADMLIDIDRWKGRASAGQDYEQALKTEEWVNEKIAGGWTYFMYEKEPKEYAGNAYPWAIYDEMH